MSARILLADDDDALRKVIQFKLKKKGYEVVSVADGEEAISALRGARFDLIISDMKMPRLGGIELLEQAKKIQTDIEVILMTAYADVSQAVKAVKLGAFDYLTKPFDDDQLFLAIGKAGRVATLERENQLLRKQIAVDGETEMLGVSKEFKALMALVEKVAPSDATLLITGESGTGKELVARLVHRKSGRREKPFVAINCAAIPRELLESELFGHVKGAFTGAIKDKRGRCELADGGTLLLDEVSELSIDLQAKLLRVIQERVVEPVGSEQRIEIDVRLLAASNVDLKKRVAEGSFREDLYYRLNVIPIHVPPLRNRAGDIPLLVRRFLSRFAPNESVEMSPQLMFRLQSYSWPGNIRELENLIERMSILRTGNHLDLGDLPPDFGIAVQLSQSAMPGDEPLVSSYSHSDTESRPTASLTYHEAEKKIVLGALQRSGWNRSKAARLLKIPRHVLLYRMKRYDIAEPT
ncbi:MAG: sigma-54 dependent transcriptional regulator [Candidatus Zixiibacteriota bacterium]